VRQPRPGQPTQQRTQAPCQVHIRQAQLQCHAVRDLLQVDAEAARCKATTYSYCSRDFENGPTEAEPGMPPWISTASLDGLRERLAPLPGRRGTGPRRKFAPPSRCAREPGRQSKRRDGGENGRQRGGRGATIHNVQEGRGATFHDRACAGVRAPGALGWIFEF
jgi:hypothetical protein